MRLFSPLEQFEIHVLKFISLGENLDFSFTSISFYSFFLIFFAAFFLSLGFNKANFIPSSWQYLVELSYYFIFEILLQQTGLKGRPFFPLFFSTFFFILFANLIGLLPFGTTVTAQIVVTFLLALSFNLSFLLIGFLRHKLDFLNLFIPKDAPKALVPLIVVIEVISYVIRTFSLSLRLFANMMAGHTLLHILSSFIVKFLQAGFLIIAILPFMLVFAITALEFGIAFIQAYVFIILLSIYLNDSLHPGH